VISAADVGTSLGGMRAHPSGGSRTRSRPLKGTARAGACRALSREVELAEGFADAGASCSWPPKPTSSSVVSTAGRAETRTSSAREGVEYYVSYAGRGAEGYWLGKRLS